MGYDRITDPDTPLRVKPNRNREVIGGTLHVLKSGCRWRDCPEVYGPHLDRQSLQTLVERWHTASYSWLRRCRLLSIQGWNDHNARMAGGGHGGPSRVLRN